MRIFISWSGERSRLVGELIDEWIRCVLQAVDPWISSNDIDRGSLWFTEINDQLRDVSIGIICLTKENKEKPWILFEAGALLKGLSTNRICTLLVDLEPKDIEDPLAQLNHTKPNKEGMRKLVKSLNVALGEQKLNDRVMNDVFEMYYPKFEESFEAILKDTPETTPVKVRDKEDVMDEMLNVLRGLDKRVRGLENDNHSRSLKSINNFQAPSQKKEYLEKARLNYVIDCAKNMISDGLGKNDLPSILRSEFDLNDFQIRYVMINLEESLELVSSE